MTAQELEAVIAGIAPVVRAYVTKTITEALDARAGIPGPSSAALETRIAVLETKQIAAPEIAPDDIAAAVSGLLRKELADLAIPKSSKRIVRDGTGAVKFEIEETR